MPGGTTPRELAGTPGRDSIASSDGATVAHPPPGWPEPDPWTAVYRGILDALHEDRERLALQREQQRPDPGPELRALAEAVAAVVVELVTSADPARRARLRPLLLALLREAQTDTEAVAA